MGCFKIDKLDKIVISFTFIIVTMFCILNSFSYASEIEEVTGVPINGVVGSLTDKVFVSDNNVKGIYYELEEGYQYTLSILEDGAYYNIWLSDNIPEVGKTYETNIGMDGNIRKYTFTATSGQILYVLSTTYSGDISHLTMTRKASSLNGAINEMVFNVGIQNIWKIFENSIPYILVVVIISLGVWFIKHNIIEHSKGRDF